MAPYMSALLINRVYAINPDGSLKWRYTTGDWVISSPAIASDGTLYIGSDDKKLYAFGSSPHIASVNPNSGIQGQTLNNVIITGNNFIRCHGSQLWRWHNGNHRPIITDNSPTQIRANISHRRRCHTGRQRRFRDHTWMEQWHQEQVASP